MILNLENFTFIRKAHNTSASHRFMLAQAASKDLLVAEASDFGPAFRIAPVIAIRSHKTGKIENFELTQTQRDREGDIMAWHFAGIDRELNVTIFND